MKSCLYKTIIQKEDPQIQVIGQACPLFVPLVEEGWLKDPVTIEIAKRYLDPLLCQDIDTLILGCTHYPLLRSMLKTLVGEQVTLVNPAYETAKELERLLKENIWNTKERKKRNFRIVFLSVMKKNIFRNLPIRFCLMM